METSFEEEFIQLCRLLGSDKYTIINEIGEPDDLDSDDNGKQFLYYDRFDVLITIPPDFLVAELIAGPTKPKISKKLDGYYSFHGVTIGDTRNDVLSKWGQPTNEHPFAWCYGNKTGTTINDYHFEIRALWDNNNPNILQGFGGMLYDYGKPNISNAKPKSGCFIATVCYGNYEAPEVLVLRQFRDDRLIKYEIGKLVVKFYYFLSPPLSRIIDKSERSKHFIRKYLLNPIITILAKGKS